MDFLYISSETIEQTELRLLKVIAGAEFEIFEGFYTFEEYPLRDFHANFNENALAHVRDKEIWSQLVPSEDKTKELFKLIGFHFKPGFDNSGFVGWLATHLKQKLGTGVFVVCGQNSGKGGIFDYWGCPCEIGGGFITEVHSLIAKGNQLL
ncbi:MAG: DUF6196 family protein [Defluviitaleaceae bacterium]|nr:DUF6196 family protein [Defluviitaleaceae bacterium]MCL2835741.1 DUF6196 family protein [Defluviitaleaceae bacterium]